MSRGLGSVQRACLKLVQESEPPMTTYDITVEVYQVKQSRDGCRYFDPAQYVAVKRALEGLQRKGLIIGFRTERWRGGETGRDKRQPQLTWMTEKGLAEWLTWARDNDVVVRQSVHLTQDAYRRWLDCIVEKARAIGMKVLG